MTVGYAKDADDLGDVRKFVEYISYPGNPSLTREADEKAAGNSDKSETDTSSQKSGGETNSSDSDTEKNSAANSSDNSDDTHHLGHTLEQHNLQDADGNTVTVTETTNGDYYFRDDNGTGFTDNGDGTWSDENGNSYTEMN